ncbi:hypothetical protein TNCV_3784351 [Trichonephila clavipes]|nr:hypothetical protein TNCV_3784351 [Trichonephila clavipes]
MKTLLICTPHQRKNFEPRQIERASASLHGGSLVDSEGILTSHCSAIRGLLTTDLVILNHGQVLRKTLELPHHTNRRTFELSTDLTCIAALHGGSLEVLGSNSCLPAMVRYLHHWATAALDNFTTGMTIEEQASLFVCE